MFNEEDKVQGQVFNKIERQVLNQSWNQVDVQVLDQVSKKVSNKVWLQVDGQIWDKLDLFNSR